jgi:glyoxylase-like metal-dependent hydrolase (beta-lactamase superfamily II)
MASYGAMFGFNIGAITPDVDLAEQKTISFGQTTAEVIHTPGHSLGGVCLYFDKAGVVVCGDTLFAGSIGRSDLPGGDYDQLMDSIVNKLLPLGGGVRVLCGHGGETTIAQEAGSNPFITEVINGGFNKPYEE